jgi:hypothetical protein
MFFQFTFRAWSEATQFTAVVFKLFVDSVYMINKTSIV